MTPDAEDPRELVRRGWDRVSKIYRPPERADVDAFGHPRSEYATWLAPILGSVGTGGAALDLGCGCGIPTCEILAQKFQVTGVDLSDVQIERARRRLPGVRFLREDMSQVRFPPGAFAVVVSLYAIIHLPVANHLPLFRKIHRWLRPGGWFLAILGESAYTGTDPDWMGWGAPMYWSHADGDTSDRWLRTSGFEVVHRSYVPEGEGGHALFLARKPGAGTLGPPRAVERKHRRGQPAPEPL
ncbi:MAG: class I SAM-dependent methyltransferase [Thermoplasmata archaeon]|nr:class I SAM-dependent methyltransferase [Thermoplasmata archaeon]